MIYSKLSEHALQPLTSGHHTALWSLLLVCLRTGQRVAPKTLGPLCNWQDGLVGQWIFQAQCNGPARLDM